MLNKLGNAIYQRHEGIFLKYENYIQEMFVKNKEEYFTKLKNSPMKLLNILQICYPYINKKDSEKIIPIILKVNINTSERKIKNLIKVWEKSKIDIAPLQAKLLLADIKND